MGGSYTKEADYVLKSDAERLKSCMYNHQCIVHSIEASVKAQYASAQLLYQELAELQNTHQRNFSGTLEKTGVILNSVQTSLSKQVGALCESFSILDNCLQEISTRYSSDDAESPPGNTENRNTGSPMSAASNQGSPAHTSKRSSSTDGSRYFDKDKEINFIRAENKAISSNNIELQTLLKQSKGKVTELELRINTLLNFKEEARRAKHEKYELEMKYTKIENDNKSLNTEILRLKRKTDAMDSLQSKLDRSENDKRFLERTIEQLRRHVYDLEEEKRKVRERKKIVENKSAVPVQLFYQRKDALMALVVNELSSMLDAQMEKMGMHLDIIRCENISNIQPDKPILVLCINSSNLGTDATSAIDGVEKSERTALLIFHHKNIHALPNQPTDRMLTSSEFKQLGCIVDLAFLTGKGIYTCDMNNVALSYIEGFLQRNYHTK
ncbi:uncharacterized protein LOC132752363 [Ruditapes philippinarum]|uniref:uncharacterized protein LOC132752363 n=1 Tax=Ruditapes philippinarum TaxID=129788 RepID=UPI00295C1765|nr:uncharacterized protein LOC132752363 [Ruditapes philippinarum]XP_060598658.1 uncharacterized protein LOC132752363 [Ruditapes philippinarum]